MLKQYDVACVVNSKAAFKVKWHRFRGKEILSCQTSVIPPIDSDHK